MLRIDPLSRLHARADIAKARLSIVQDVIRGVPDQVAEPISEESWKRDRGDKKGLYEQFGVIEYWIIDPEARTTEVFVLGRRGYELHSRAEFGAEVAKSAVSKLLPGLTVSWTQLTA